MAFMIMKTFINRKAKLGLIDLKKQMFDEMIQCNHVGNAYQPLTCKMEGLERPPMVEIPAYRDTFIRGN